MKIRIFILLTSVILVATHFCMGQDYHHISTKDGLSERKPIRIFQDSRGVIWIKTYSGLHVYDGYKASYIPEIFSGFDKRCFMAEDDFGHLYFFDKKTVQVVDLYDYTKSVLYQTDFINGVSIDKEGRGVMFCNGKNYIYTQDQWVEKQVLTREVQEIIDQGFWLRNNQSHWYQLRGDPMYDVLLDSNYNLVHTWNPDNHPSFTHHDAGKILVDKKGDIWYDFFHGPLMKWSEEEEVFELAVGTLDDEFWLRAFLPEGEDDFILSGLRKVWGYNIELDSIYLISDAYPQDQYSPHSVMKDLEGNLFLLGAFGVYMVKKVNSDFKVFITENKTSSTNENSVRSITKIGDKQLFVSAKEGNYIYHSDDDSISNLGLKNDHIRGGTLTEDGEVYFANIQNGLVQYDPIAKNYRELYGVSGLSEKFNGLHRIGDQLWLSHLYSLEVYDVKDDRVFNFENWEYGTTFFVYRLTDDTYLLGTEKGLLMVTSSFEIVKSWNTTSEPSLSSDYVYHISSDEEGTLWVSTRKGIDLFNQSMEKVGHFDIKDGLPNNRIYACHHEKQNVWIPTDNGLSLYDKKFKVFKNYNTKHGLPHQEFNSNAFHMDTNALYLGTLNGFVSVNLDNEYVIEKDIPIYITSIAAYNSRKKDKVEKGISESQLVRLKPYESNLKISLGMAHYNDAKENVYRYKIKDYHNSWKVIQGNLLELETLEPGSYSIQIRGTASDGKISTNVELIKLTVEEAFTKSYAFILLCIAGIGLLFWVLYKYRLKQLLRVANVREQISKNLHDEVGGMMTRIAFESDLVLSDAYNSEESKEKIKEIAENSRSVSILMSDIVWSMDNRKDKFDDLQQRMRQQLYLMLSPREISYTINPDKLDVSKKLKADVRQNVYLIFKEAIHNITKHSNGDLVSIVLDNSESFYMLIKDNGSSHGLNGNFKTGQGIQNMTERAASIGGKLTITQKEGYEVHLNLNTRV